MPKKFAKKQILLQSSYMIQCILWFEIITLYLVPVCQVIYSILKKYVLLLSGEKNP